jgi:predicted RNA-binding protein with PUA-like domain
MSYWLVKSEPSVYSWDQFAKEKETAWTGIRNYAARLNLRGMKKGEEVLFYHSNEGTDIVGLAKVTKEVYHDPTTEDERWEAVDIKAVKKLKQSITLETLKKDTRFANMDLVRLGRLSVQKVTNEEWKMIMKLAGE